ncbi:MAG: Hsp20/alpha crystallin family protein [Planctomycetes bacterium]|nr:Hsp20/alpha crystallin family protein [Planctomycetota bacterium]
MLMTRWDRPFSDVWSEMNRLHQQMNQLFDRFGFGGERFGDGTWPALAVSYPALNVWEDAECVFAEAELPGMELSDLEIYVTGGNQLTIKGERKAPSFEKATWHRQERGFGQFTRVITLPIDVNEDKVTAEFSHGVLTITMPKSEKARPKKITVKAE